MATLAGTRTSTGPAHIMGPRLLLIISSFALTVLGIVMVYSASSVTILTDAYSSGTLESANPAEYVIDQLVFAVVGIALAFIAWRFLPPSVWNGWVLWVAWGAAMFLLVLTAVAGTDALGAQRWLVIGPVSLQPSEFAKIAFVLMAAHIFNSLYEGETTVRDFVVQVLVLIILPLGVLYATQSDLGTTVIIAVGILAVMWLGGVPTKVILIVLGALALFGAYAILGTGYRSGRLVVYDPWNDGAGGQGDGYQTIHSFYAFAEGGLFGVGLGNSREKYDYLPEAETDFVFSIIGEELGLVGAAAVILLFLVFLYAGMRIARASQSRMGAMIAGSCTIMIVFQAFLNIGCVIGLVPTTGKPLPFLSSGGSSLISTLIMVGLILAVSRESDQPSVYEQRRANLRVVRTAAPEPSSGRGGRSSSKGRGGRVRRAARDVMPGGRARASRR